MTHRNFRFLVGVALALLLGAASVPLLNTSTTSAQSGVPQGSTTTFAILAGQAVTSTGLSVVNAIWVSVRAPRLPAFLRGS